MWTKTESNKTWSNKKLHNDHPASLRRLGHSPYPHMRTLLGHNWLLPRTPVTITWYNRQFKLKTQVLNTTLSDGQLFQLDHAAMPPSCLLHSPLARWVSGPGSLVYMMSRLCCAPLANKKKRTYEKKHQNASNQRSLWLHAPGLSQFLLQAVTTYASTLWIFSPDSKSFLSQSVPKNKQTMAALCWISQTSCASHMKAVKRQEL